jgi:hypothetical protein
VEGTSWSVVRRSIVHGAALYWWRRGLRTSAPCGLGAQGTFFFFHPLSCWREGRYNYSGSTWVQSTIIPFGCSYIGSFISYVSQGTLDYCGPRKRVENVEDGR